MSMRLHSAISDKCNFLSDSARPQPPFPPRHVFRRNFRSHLSQVFPIFLRLVSYFLLSENPIWYVQYLEIRFHAFAGCN